MISGVPLRMDNIQDCQLSKLMWLLPFINGNEFRAFNIIVLLSLEVGSKDSYCWLRFQTGHALWWKAKHTLYYSNKSSFCSDLFKLDTRSKEYGFVKVNKPFIDSQYAFSFPGETTAAVKQTNPTNARENKRELEDNKLFVHYLSIALSWIFKALAAWPNGICRTNAHFVHKFLDHNTTVMPDQSPNLVNDHLISAWWCPTRTSFPPPHHHLPYPRFSDVRPSLK